MHANSKVVVVIPCYNEARRLDRAAMLSFFRAHPEIAVCFVNDGSTDETPSILREVEQALGTNACVIDLPANVGKGEAVRQGVLAMCRESAAPYIAYWDADLAAPLDELLGFLRYAEHHPDTVWISGARIHRRGAVIARHPLRYYLGRVFTVAVSRLLGLSVRDPQCGAKLLHAETAKVLFDAPFVSRWIFDVELLARLVLSCGHETAQAAIYEWPLSSWRDVGGSKVRAWVFLRAAVDFMRIARKYPAVFLNRRRASP